MDRGDKHTGKRTWTSVDERSKQKEGRSAQPCIRTLIDSPERGGSSEHQHQPRPEELRPPYRHKNIDTYFETNEEIRALRKKQKIHISHRISGERSASLPRSSNTTNVKDDSTDSSMGEESDVDESIHDGDGWSDYSYSDNEGDWDDLEEWEGVAMAYQDWFSGDVRLGVMKRDLPAGSVVSIPRRLNNSLFSEAQNRGSSHVTELNTYDSDEDTVSRSHTGQGELSMTYLLGLSGVTPTKTPKELVSSLQETQFAEPAGIWAPGELWICDDDMDDVLRRLGKMSFDTGESRYLQCLHFTKGHAYRRDAHTDASLSPSHTPTSSIKRLLSPIDSTSRATTKKKVSTGKGKGKRVSYRNDGHEEDDEEEEEEEEEEDTIKPTRISGGEEGRGTSHRHRPRQESRVMSSSRPGPATLVSEGTDHYQEASAKGYADGMKRHREEAAELEAELAYSTYGNLVDIANKMPGVSADTLQSIKETQDKYPDTGTVRVPVLDEGEWRRARATHARMKADQFTPGDACDYCIFMSTTSSSTDPSNNDTHIATRTTTRILMEKIAAEGLLIIGGRRMYYAEEIEKVYMRYLRTLPLSSSDLGKMRPPRSMTLNHFFNKNGCTSGPLHIVNDFIRHLDSTNDAMRQRLYEQRVCMGGVPIGMPEVNVKIHKMLTENANTLVKLTKERREIQKETPSYVDTAQSQLVTAQQRAAMALVGQPGASSLSGANRM